jgi:hypothetical protein
MIRERHDPALNERARIVAKLGAMRRLFACSPTRRHLWMAQKIAARQPVPRRPVLRKKVA